MKYYSPNSLNELMRLINVVDDSIYLSGGTDLMPRFENGKRLPQNLIDLKSVSELNGIRELNDTVEIGALTTISDLNESPLIQSYYNSIFQATQKFAGVQIRNRATIGGNICNASPAGDLLPSLYAFNAKVKIANYREYRIIPIEDFITNPGKISLNSDEVLYSIILPKTQYSSIFVKLGLRETMAISVINFAIVFEMINGIYNHISIAAGAVGPKIARLKSLEDALRENPKINVTMDLLLKDISPISDIRASARYRKTVLFNLIKSEIDKNRMEN
jgi:CO/xanthine dehydrogenase FAD-binding subunit